MNTFSIAINLLLGLMIADFVGTAIFLVFVAFSPRLRTRLVGRIRFLTTGSTDPHGVMVNAFAKMNELEKAHYRLQESFDHHRGVRYPTEGGVERLTSAATQARNARTLARNLGLPRHS